MILKTDEIYTILREVNFQVCNSMPADLGHFINLPYFKLMRDDENMRMIPSSVMTQGNPLRFFYNIEIFKGMKRIELMKDT